jgi:hypothetical protein
MRVLKSWRLGTRLAAYLRVSLLLATLLAAAGASSVRAAERQLGERLRGFGETLLAVPGFAAHTSPRQLTLNGIELGVVTLSTPDDVPTTLARLHRLCERGGLDAPEALLAPAGSAEPRLAGGIFEEHADREGVIACLDTGGKLDLEELVSRLGKVRETGDLSELGGLRYALVRRSGNTSTVLALWTDGKVEVTRLFPASGDAPGFDPTGLPRPAGTRRLLSAAEHAAPYAIALYESAGQSPAAILSAQEVSLAASGWRTRQDPGTSALVATRDGRAVIYAAGTSGNGLTFLGVSALARE